MTQPVSRTPLPCPAGVPTTKDTSRALSLLQRETFHVLATEEEREALRLYANVSGRHAAARHLEERQRLLPERVWSDGNATAMQLLEGGTIRTDDRIRILRLFTAAFFAGYQAYQADLDCALRKARRQGLRSATLFEEVQA